MIALELVNRPEADLAYEQHDGIFEEIRTTYTVTPAPNGGEVIALAHGGMSGVRVLSRATADEVLTPKRRELVETLRITDADSVRALARELDRDKGQVGRDLGALAEHGIVHYGTDRNAKRPRLTQEHIVVEPIVRTGLTTVFPRF